MSNAPVRHKLLFYACMILILIIGEWIVFDVFIAGVRIFVFGLKLMVIPIVIIAAIYLTWHFRKFFK
jgi:hypothetical protein